MELYTTLHYGSELIVDQSTDIWNLRKLSFQPQSQSVDPGCGEHMEHRLSLGKQTLDSMYAIRELLHMCVCVANYNPVIVSIITLAFMLSMVLGV